MAHLPSIQCVNGMADTSCHHDMRTYSGQSINMSFKFTAVSGRYDRTVKALHTPPNQWIYIIQRPQFPLASGSVNDTSITRSRYPIPDPQRVLRDCGPILHYCMELVQAALEAVENSPGATSSNFVIPYAKICLDLISTDLNNL